MKTHILKGWVARDDNGYLYLHTEKPYYDENDGMWYNEHDNYIDIPANLSIIFDEIGSVHPKHVKITIEELES